MVLKLSVIWQFRQLPKNTSLLAVDVLAGTPENVPSGFHDSQISLSSSEAVQFLVQQLKRKGSVIRLLLSAVDGYLVQSDFLSRRLIDCKDVVKVREFTLLDQRLKSTTVDACKTSDFANLLSHAIGAMVISSKAWSETQSVEIDNELNRRLSFPWHSTKPCPKRRLAIIRPGPTSKPQSLEKLEDLAQIAASFNTELVLFDEPGHELANAEWSHLREDFVGIDLTLTDDLPERIAAAVLAYPKPFDGIMATYEGLLTAVAQAATLLGLPTSSPKSYATARNKYETRLLDQGLFVHCIKTEPELEKFIAGYRTVAPTMPLIVKPADGWASEGVCKVKSESELREAVTQLINPPSSSKKYGRDIQCSVVVEPYVDGPEVDINMALVDGELVFFDINDDFPSSGDGGIYDGGGSGFVETLNALPSSLPAAEIDLIRSKAHKIVLDMGFRTGVFHVEARVHNSSFDHIKGDDGIVDLVAKPLSTDVKVTTTAAVYVLEVNARAPGGRITGATNRSYGVSYRALGMLAAFGDHERLRALATPFVGGAQYHMQAIYIAARRGGIYGDVFATIFERDPALRDNVMYYLNFLKHGEAVSDAKTIALCLVASRKSRRDAHAISKTIQHIAWEITSGS